MEPLGGLLHRRPDQEQPVFTAAFVVDQITAIVGQQLGLPVADAQAISIKHGTATIRVSHPAIAGRIQHQEAELCQQINKKMRLSGARVEPITRLTTRWSPSRE